jgi:hypothetical protein
MKNKQHTNSICDLGWGWKFAPESYSDLIKGEV